jgi:tetratricopeptide (TPR) repeat protein
MRKLVVLALMVGVPCDTPAQVASQAQMVETVKDALARSERGEFATARQSLEGWFRRCGTSPEAFDCREVFASGLGALFQRQAAVDRRNRDSLYRKAIAYYDTILREAPEQPDIIYDKAIAYRALGPHEWQEPFFRRAPTLDPSRNALYLTFLGDYLAKNNRWSEAASAYSRAEQQDPDDDGARSGLITALSALGGARRNELLRHAARWADSHPESARDAYRAVLAASFGAVPRADFIADSAILGLVSVQARNRFAIGAVPDSVDPLWTPVREIREFVRDVTRSSAPWWLRNQLRREALARTALATGRSALASARYDRAERFWVEGLNLAQRTSPLALALQRELAVLYFQQPALDPGRRKFDALEQTLFIEKAAFIAGGDLEASQRYHTTLALIYVERGVWRSERHGRNARQQFTWALEVADTRRGRDNYHQPLPELRQALARGLDSLGSRGEAGQRYLEAARDFLDVDELEAAARAAENAIRLGQSFAASQWVVAFRSDMARWPDSLISACTGPRFATLAPGGDASFAARQRFKVLSDCSRAGQPPADMRHAIAAFELIDRGAATLVGGGDVERFERVMRSLLTPFSVTFRPGHLDEEPAPRGTRLMVSLPGESSPRWYTASRDDLIAARVAAELHGSVSPFPITVVDGALSIPDYVVIPPEVMQRLRAIRGVQSVGPVSARRGALR